MSNTKNGIDVSEWQKEIDWDKVKPQIDFAVIKSVYACSPVLRN